MLRVKSLNSSERVLRDEPDFYTTSEVMSAGTEDYAPPWMAPATSATVEPTPIAPQHKHSWSEPLLPTFQRSYASSVFDSMGRGASTDKPLVQDGSLISVISRPPGAYTLPQPQLTEAVGLETQVSFIVRRER
jgi:hypothetical protein